ncbi:MAG: hypothetical protein J5789_02910 [Oscillospiraceae bacterium]|nr:hypothetical protein [Oscillospiraceae bacterium]MBR4393129.1 hypothetical protein [Oscillospiraceae bacterium]
MQVKKELRYEDLDLSRFRKVFHPDEAAIEKEILYVRQKKLQWERGVIASSGDVITARLQSELQRFNREGVKITLGLGLLSRELENALIGHSCGEKVTCSVKGTSVTVIITDIQHKVVPPLDDEMLVEENLPGVTDKMSFHTYQVEKQRDEAATQLAYEIREEVIKEILTGSCLEITETDYQHWVDLQMNRIEWLSRFQGLELSDMTPSQISARIPVSSYEEIAPFLLGGARETMPLVALGSARAASDGYTVSREDYDNWITQCATDWHCTPEEFARAEPFELYEMNALSDYYYMGFFRHLKSLLVNEEDG